MSSVRFSLIVANMNGGRDLRAAVDSALAQTYPHLEIILLDNGSDDGSDQYLRDVAERGDPRVTFVAQTERLIAPANWNRAVPFARGEYVSILHADDVIKPDYVARMVAFMERGFYDWGACLASNIDENGAGLYSLRNVYKMAASVFYKLGAFLTGKNSPGTVLLALGDFIVCPTVVFRRDCYLKSGGFDPRFRFAVDWEYWLRLSPQYNFGFLLEHLYYHRVHRQSDSKQNQTNLQYTLEEYDICQNYLKHLARFSPVRMLNWFFLSAMFFSDALIFLKGRDLKKYRAFVRELPQEYRYLRFFL